MMKRILALTTFCCLFGLTISARNIQLWNGKKCAVVLTYDDGLNVHLDNAIRLLDSLGLKGTFYIPGNSLPFADRIDEWRQAAAQGHELGNHTLFHPCNGNLPGRSWVSKDHDLANYSYRQIIDEVKLGNTFLKAVDGKADRTFAYTCGDREVEGKLFYNELKTEFAAARAVSPALNQIKNIDLSNVNSYMINGESGAQLIALAKRAMENGSLLVFLFHGVGGEHSLNVSLEAHRELLQFLKENEKEIWTATMVDAAIHIAEYQK